MQNEDVILMIIEFLESGKGDSGIYLELGSGE